MHHPYAHGIFWLGWETAQHYIRQITLRGRNSLRRPKYKELESVSSVVLSSLFAAPSDIVC